MLEQYNACRKQWAVRLEVKDRDTFSLMLGKDPPLFAPMRACLSCISSIVLILASGGKFCICDFFQAIEQEYEGHVSPVMNRK